MADVAVYISSIGHSFDNGGKVVICQDHGCGILRHFCSGDPHGDTNICLFKGRGIINPVSSHCYNVASGLPCIDNADFMLRGDPGINGNPI